MSFKNVFKHVPIFPSFLDKFSLDMEFWVDRVCKIGAHCFTDVNTLSSGLQPLLFMMRLWISCLALFPWLKIFFPLAAFSILYFLSLLAYDYDPPCFCLYLCYFELAEIHGSIYFCTLLNLVNGGHYFFKNMSYPIVLLSDIIPHWLSVPFLKKKYSLLSILHIEKYLLICLQLYWNYFLLSSICY